MSAHDVIATRYLLRSPTDSAYILCMLEADGGDSPTPPAPKPPASEPSTRSRWLSWTSSGKLTLFFEGVTALTAVMGLTFLVVQLRQTNSALEQARLANQIAQTAQKAAAEDSTEQRAALKEQLDLMRKSVDAASTLSENSVKNAEAATQSAVALAESNRIAFDNAARSQRAAMEERRPELYLTTRFRPKEPETADDEFWFDTQVTNSGKSRARRVREISSLGSARESLPRKEWNYSELANTRARDIAPGESSILFVSNRLSLSLPGVKRYLDGETEIILQQLVTYCDDYGRLHSIEICVVHEHDRPDYVYYCGAGNETREITNAKIVSMLCSG